MRQGKNLDLKLVKKYKIDQYIQSMQYRWKCNIVTINKDKIK